MPPSAAAPLGLCFLEMFLIILYHRCLWIFLIYSLYIPYIFPKYVPYIVPCVFLNLWSQEKTSPYRKTAFLFVFVRFYTFCWEFGPNGPAFMCLLRQGGSDRFGSASENYMHRIQVRTWIAELGEQRSTRSSVLQLRQQV